MKILLSTIAVLATVAVVSADSFHTKKHSEIMKNIEDQEFDATSPMYYV